MIRHLIWLLIILTNHSISTSQSNAVFTDLLAKYVNSDGQVNYEGFMAERSKFEAYLTHLSTIVPNSQWSENQRKAYWINTYNAFTIKLIIDNYPLDRITDLHPMFYIPGLNTIWHKEFFQIGGEEFSLDRIEHEILRPEFNDARIHFAINCASFSCPKLRNEAYESSKIDEQLNDQATQFVNDVERNKISTHSIEISRIFSWFMEDFERNSDLISFLNLFSKIKIDSEAQIKYLPYNWDLNKQ